MPVPASRNKWRRPATGTLVALALLAGTTVLFAQTSLKMPDFRQGVPDVAQFRAGESCDNCGVIRSIREVQTRRPVPVPPSIQSGPSDRSSLSSPVYVGAVIALPLGEGSGRSYVGGVGTPEMQERFSESTYEIAIKLESGSETILQRRDGAAYRVGDSVRVQGGQLSLVSR
jgi:hypothetical protein